MQNWIKKRKDSKRNGAFDKYNTINKSVYLKFFDNLFAEVNWCYLTIIFPEKEYRINTILWQDEIDLLKLVISVPFKYRIYYVSEINHRFCLEISLITVPNVAKEAYNTLNKNDFCEYYKKALKGY